MATVSAYKTPEPSTRAAGGSTLAKVVGALALVGVAWVHVLDLGGKLSETPYLGYAYIALIVGSLVAAAMILANRRSGWALGGALALGAILAYVLSRTTGLPYATDDIGNWLEPLGVWALSLEGVVVLLSAYALGRVRRTTVRSH